MAEWEYLIEPLTWFFLLAEAVRGPAIMELKSQGDGLDGQ